MKQNPVLSAEAHFYLKTFTGRQRKSLHIRIWSALAQGFADSTGNREWWQEGAELVDWSFFARAETWQGGARRKEGRKPYCKCIVLLLEVLCTKNLCKSANSECR